MVVRSAVEIHKEAFLTPVEDPAPELVAQLAQETYNTDLLHHLVLNVARFEFEARKDVVQIFNNLLRRQIGTRWPTVEYLSAKHEVIFAALAGYENEEIALNTGMILKEMLRHEQLAKILLHSDQYVPATTMRAQGGG
jgi:calcium binding protein 39